MKVRAIARGYYGDVIRMPGDVFVIGGPKEFSDKWMERVRPAVPEKVTGTQAALSQETGRIVREKAGMDDPPPAGGENVLGD